MQNHRIEHFSLGNIPAIKISNDFADATLLLQGAQLIQYQAKNQPALFWENTEACFELGHAVRQGIPVCWPWFGQFEKNPPGVQKSFEQVARKEAHGFARAALWTLEACHHNNEGSQVVFALNNQNPQIPLSLSLHYHIGRTLRLKLITRNHSQQSVEFSQALHSYFAVENISHTQVQGLEDCHYFDALDDWQEKVQRGPVNFQSECDRVYFNTADVMHIAEHSGRKIRLHSTGSASAVVWNPWLEKSLTMSQMPKEAYKKFLCVETANAASDTIHLTPGEQHNLLLDISAN